MHFLDSLKADSVIAATKEPVLRIPARIISAKNAALKKNLEIFFCKFYFYATNRPNGDDDGGALEQKYHKMIFK